MRKSRAFFTHEIVYLYGIKGTFMCCNEQIKVGKATNKVTAE